MKAILTKFYGPTDTKPARVKAYDMDGNCMWVTSADHNDPHFAAAHALCAKMNWEGDIIGGAIKGGYAFVFAEKKE